MTVLYRNSRAWRVRFLHVLFWAAALGFAALALFDHRYGPDPDSWLVGAILSPIFVLFALGMEWYLRCYVTQLEDADSGLVVETLSTVGTTRAAIPWTDVELAGERRDISHGGDAPSVDNSAEVLRVRGRALLIIDTTEDAFDAAALRRALRRKRAS